MVKHLSSPTTTGEQPEQDVRAELVARATALQPLLRGHSARAEAERVLPAEVVDAMAEAGIFRQLTPKRYGGSETDLRTLIQVSETLGEGDGSAAWVGMIIAVTNWLACLFPDQAQEEVFGADADARVTGVAAPTGVGERVAGGWRVSGKWSYNSGAPFATWAALGVLLKDDRGEISDHSLALIPASELAFEDTWHTAGMKATASGTLVGQDVFVPEHRVLSVPAAAEGIYPRTTRDTALYSSAFGPMLVLCLTGPLLGLGRAALTAAREAAVTKPLSFTVHNSQADSVGVQMQVAEAALKLESARLLVYRAADEVDRGAHGGPLSLATRSHIRARAGFAAQQVVEAINVLANVHGSSAFADSNILQRIWRDANVAARHAGLIPAVGLEVHGKSLLGVSERVSLML
ncbi:acyl-CoA dehydrogenase family protein [Streptomyces sp. NPDC086077]|uniref:acyl-CoA dehydrogenase family protein n=1 Tax=Streptomyces sp. NPDC086077 TaxID=3154862 RepID=UPI003417AACD